MRAYTETATIAAASHAFVFNEVPHSDWLLARSGRAVVSDYRAWGPGLASGARGRSAGNAFLRVSVIGFRFDIDSCYVPPMELSGRIHRWETRQQRGGENCYPT